MSDSNLSISRRNALRGAAVVTAAGFAAPGLAQAAGMLGVSGGLRTYTGRYALPGGKIIEGVFVAPAGRATLDTVVVLHGDQGIDARAEAMANYFAASGKLVVVPDLGRGAAREAKAAQMRALAPSFGKRGMANGNVEYVAA